LGSSSRPFDRSSLVDWLVYPLEAHYAEIVALTQSGVLSMIASRFMVDGQRRGGHNVLDDNPEWMPAELGRGAFRC
jgi:hypothetical protein